MSRYTSFEGQAVSKFRNSGVERYHYRPECGPVERYYFAEGVTLAAARTAIDQVTAMKVDLVMAGFNASGSNARKIWYHLGRMFMAVSYSTTSAFSDMVDDDAFWPFYEGAFKTAVAKCVRTIPKPTMAPTLAPTQAATQAATKAATKAAAEYYAAFSDTKYCPTDKDTLDHCTSRVGCQYFVHPKKKGDHVCTENPQAFCKALAPVGSMTFSAAVDGESPGCYAVGSACTRLPEIARGQGAIDEAGLCKPKGQIRLNNASAGPGIATPAAFFRALEPAGLADKAMADLQAATQSLFALAKAAVAAPEQSCEALMAIGAYWAGELDLARKATKGCFRVLIEPAWDRAYAAMSTPAGPLAFKYMGPRTDENVLGPHLAIAPLLRYKDADPGFAEWGAWQ